MPKRLKLVHENRRKGVEKHTSVSEGGRTFRLDQILVRSGKKILLALGLVI